MKKINAGMHLLKNMGPRYLIFRIIHLISRRTGYFSRKFPISPPQIDVIGVEHWKNNLPPFFFYGKNIPDLKKQESEHLQNLFREINEGTFTFFGKKKYHLGNDYDWVTNPVSGFKYEINQHWSSINELSEESGDIKFVWEKARFSFLYDVIRYDFHHNKDCSELVFSQINSFIDKNQINLGPNYVCSQEISLRILNWIFALYYYKDSKFLTEDLFRKIMNSIYWQINHVYKNIRFSLIAVRNNHALTETLMLYLSGLLFPFLPDVMMWSKEGKEMFEKEIGYQIYDDGTYLQFSNNYHRVVVQLLTWGIRLAELNNDKFSAEVIVKAKKSLVFLTDSMELSSGMLPNYGANDGALFFNLNNQDYRDYRPQLQALSYTLNTIPENKFGQFFGEDIFWMGLSRRINSQFDIIKKSGLNSYPDGGYYLMHDNDSMTYIRCGNHKDRPSQADNLHLDIWYKGANILRDNGSFLYNSEPSVLKYFMGTGSHNTVMLGDFDQMLKGPRFTWFDWSQSIEASLIESDGQIEFQGLISAFTYIDKNIRHRRKVTKVKGKPRWLIEDEIIGTEKFEMNQLWHFDPASADLIIIKAHDDTGMSLEKNIIKGWYSSYYGVKEKSEYYIYTTVKRKIITQIEIAE
jgi:hypothetical protein